MTTIDDSLLETMVLHAMGILVEVAPHAIPSPNLPYVRKNDILPIRATRREVTPYLGSIYRGRVSHASISRRQWRRTRQRIVELASARLGYRRRQIIGDQILPLEPKASGGQIYWVKADYESAQKQT